MKSFSSLVSEFEIDANARLSPEKIHIYLKDIRYVQGTEILEIVFHYLIFICGKYLQMMVAYHISKEDPESLTSELQKFSENHQKMLSAFAKVNGYELVLGKVPDPKVSQINPQVLNFLEALGLSELKSIFAEEESTVEDLLSMTNEDLKDIGIKKLNQRKKILNAKDGITGKLEASKFQIMLLRKLKYFE